MRERIMGGAKILLRDTVELVITLLVLPVQIMLVPLNTFLRIFDKEIVLRDKGYRLSYFIFYISINTILLWLLMKPWLYKTACDLMSGRFYAY